MTQNTEHGCDRCGEEEMMRKHVIEDNLLCEPCAKKLYGGDQ